MRTEYGFENSPAIYGWAIVRAIKIKSRQGRKKLLFENGQAIYGWVRKKMHSFNSCLVHCVFSTKERRPWLTPAIRERLWPHLGGIARENSMKALAIGGAADHAHLLLSLPATLSISKAMQLLKGNSSKWLRETFPELRLQGFAWQEGFGAFSIGLSGVEETNRYIQSQEEHHRKRSFREELEVFLKKHGCAHTAEMLD